MLVSVLSPPARKEALPELSPLITCTGSLASVGQQVLLKQTSTVHFCRRNARRPKMMMMKASSTTQLM